MTNVAIEFTVREILEKAMTDSNSKLTETWIDLDEEFSTPITYAWIFSLSLTGAARVWWLSEKDNKITSWGMLVGRFFYKYFPLSRNGKCYIENHCNKGGFGYYDFMAWIDLKNYDKRIDRLTKCALGHAWIYKWGIDDSKSDITSNDEEWEESGYKNPHNTIGDSLLEPNMDTRNKYTKQCENGFNTEKAPSSSNMNDTQPNGKRNHTTYPMIWDMAYCSLYSCVFNCFSAF
uniref:Uncharacterized protein n=1 Tax=Tanacetum cinerariifolium TaxID=118510 RepID=A0A6L2KZQ0_TANCI|nr:hypothetical protein [Tanacetum cinerariifolium]